MSKSLEALNKIAYSYGYDENILIISKSLKAHEEYVKIAEKEHEELMYAQKKLKALEIIKEKGVDVSEIFIQKTLYGYNRFAGVHPNNNYYRKELTQEEYDLLKEVLL